MAIGFNKKQLDQLFKKLNNKLTLQKISGELFLVGGAVMCLVYHARPSTKDVDAYFQPSHMIRVAAEELGEEEGLSKHWLNDAVKGYLSQHGRFDLYLELSHLKIFHAQPEYLFAMKCLSMRIGEEFHDLDDVKFLAHYLGIRDYPDAIAMVKKYYPLERIPQKTLYALEELLQA